MRINELFDKGKAELDFDLADDLIFYIQNDSDFYRTEYFPFLDKFQKYQNSGKETSPILFKNLVLRAYNSYKRKFEEGNKFDKLSVEQIQDICNKLYNIEHQTSKKEK